MQKGRECGVIFMKKHDLQIQALLYAISQYPDIGRTKLMKFIFLTDLVWYNQHNETVFEDEYVRMPKGPVPVLAYALTSVETSHEYFDVEKIQTPFGNDQYIFRLKMNPDLSCFPHELIELMDKILEYIKSNNANDISEFIHRFRLWRLIENGRKIPKDLFKLDEYEAADILSCKSLNIANRLKKQALRIEGEIPIEPVSKEFVKAQLKVLSSEK